MRQNKIDKLKSNIEDCTNDKQVVQLLDSKSHLFMSLESFNEDNSEEIDIVSRIIQACYNQKTPERLIVFVKEMKLQLELSNYSEEVIKNYLICLYQKRKKTDLLEYSDFIEKNYEKYEELRQVRQYINLTSSESKLEKAFRFLLFIGCCAQLIYSLAGGDNSELILSISLIVIITKIVFSIFEDQRVFSSSNLMWFGSLLISVLFYCLIYSNLLSGTNFDLFLFPVTLILIFYIDRINQVK